MNALSTAAAEYLNQYWSILRELRAAVIVVVLAAAAAAAAAVVVRAADLLQINRAHKFRNLTQPIKARRKLWSFTHLVS